MLEPVELLDNEFHEAVSLFHVTLEFNIPKIMTVTDELPTIEATFTLRRVIWLEFA